jgi:hypothetical protein
MVDLNLPSFEYKIKKTDEKVFIFDEFRKKYVVLTPEEWVRQHFIHYMIAHLHYPNALITIETGLVYNRLRKRSDIVLYDREGNPWMLVECKAPNHPVGPAAVRQVSMYNATIRARYIVVTNGLTTVCCSVDVLKNTTEVLHRFPDYS